MATFTLDQIRAAAEAKFGSTEIPLSDGQVVVLRNPLRLESEERKALSKAQESLMEADDELAALGDILLVVADTKAGAKALIKEIGDDLGSMLALIEMYGEGEQVGEA